MFKAYIPPLACDGYVCDWPDFPQQYNVHPGAHFYFSVSFSLATPTPRKSLVREEAFQHFVNIELLAHLLLVKNWIIGAV